MDFLFEQNNNNGILDIILFEANKHEEQKQIEVHNNNIRNKFISDVIIDDLQTLDMVKNHPNKTAYRYPNNTVDRYPNNTVDRYPTINRERYPNNTVKHYPAINIDRYSNNKNIEKLKEEYMENCLINEESENIEIFLDRIGIEEEIIFDKSQNKWILSKSNF